MTQPSDPLTPEMMILKRLVMAWEVDDDMEFLAAMTLARRLLGFTEDAEDLEVLAANGYDVAAELERMRQP
jgi:hypothetical protein